MDLKPAPKRLLSIDVFRGITISGMILVNSPGNDDSHAALRHAAWHGWTAADFVFPSFLFIMGVSLAVSLGRRLERGEATSRLMRQVLWRSAVIFALGLVINVFDSGSAPGFRILGVMQRIGLCYLVSGFFFLRAGTRVQSGAAALFLVGYWLLMTIVALPGAGPGGLTPEGNLASRLDRFFLGPHMETPVRDSEGILSTIPAFSNALLGVLAGQWVRSHRPQPRKAAMLLTGGGACLALGLLWGRSFPINKHIWTSSYALLTGGLALCGFTVCYTTIEILEIKGWGKPFQVFGRNPLLSYFLSGLGYGVMEFVAMRAPDGGPMNLKLWLCGRLFGPWLSTPDASLMFALAYLCLCFGVMGALYRKKIFLKI